MSIQADSWIMKEVELVVAGGGPAGVAAAETAARKGLSVLLIEKEGFLGGQAVGGLSATICGLYLTNEKWTHENGPVQIVYGFAERFRQKMIEKGGLTQPQLYGNTYVDAHEPFVWKCVAEEMLRDAGAEILYHSIVCDAKCEEGNISQVTILTAEGYYTIKAKYFIDATGDAALTAAAGGAFRYGIEGTVQNPSFIFKLCNVDEEKFWRYFGENTICHDAFSDKIREAESVFHVSLPRKKIWTFHCVHPGEIYVNATSVSKPDGSSINCIHAEEITYAETMGRKQALDYARMFQAFIPGCENAYIGEHASHIGVRQTRSVVCKERLTNSDVEQCVKRPDGIAKSSWPIELHRGEAPILVWLTNNYYEIPYDAMVPKNFKNLLVAGRCIDAEHQALASSRVTAQCFAMGHAAGIAAKIAIEKEIGFDFIDGVELRQALNQDGACLDKGN